MLKFFAVRDDENESLLGAITEGKASVAAGGDALLVINYLRGTGGWYCAPVFATQIRWYSILLRALVHIRNASACENQLRTYTRYPQTPQMAQWVSPRWSVPCWSCCNGVRGECRIAAGLGACERIKHVHVWWMRHCPGKRSLLSTCIGRCPAAFSGNVARNRNDAARISCYGSCEGAEDLRNHLLC